jgi:type 1 glutamine amidotransferase
VNRRSFVSQLALLPLAAGTAGLALAAPAAPRRRLLCFTKSAGWIHSVVKPGPDGSPSVVDRAMTALGARHGFDVVCTKDGGVFTAAGLRPFDAVFFYTTEDVATRGADGQPPMPPGGKEALLRAVRGGMGFLGVHSASDTFHTQPDPPDRSTRRVAHGRAVDPYIAMLGGEFMSHGPEQPGRLRVVDAAFPGMSGFADGASRMGEWYSLKDFAPDLHVLMTLDTAGMQGADYARPPFPVTWARRHGRGRVFYSALGHREEEWSDPAFLGLLAGAARWAFGDAGARVVPNLAAAAPRHAELPPAPPAAPR